MRRDNMMHAVQRTHTVRSHGNTLLALACQLGKKLGDVRPHTHILSQAYLKLLGLMDILCQPIKAFLFGVLT